MIVVVAATGLGSAPHAWAQRVLGLDISAWQGNISQTTWNNIRNLENRQFVFLRSSRGGTTGHYNQSNPDNDDPLGENTLSQRYDDPYFVQNINRATAAGIYAGSYHFSRPDIIATTLNANGIPNDGADEANHFLQMAGAWMRPGYLMPVHDLEAGAGVRTDNEIAQFVIDFSDRIQEVMGIRPAIYTNGNYAENVLGDASTSLQNQVVAGYPTLWSARWPNQSNPNSIDVQNGHPNNSYPEVYGPWDDSGVTHPWHFWQYASTGRLQSYKNGSSNLDFNVAQGDAESLKDRLVPALWMNDSSGAWSTLANWNSGQTPVAPVTGPGQVPPVGTQTLPTPRLPGATGSGITSGQHDTVILDRPNANITVTLASGNHNIRKLFVREGLAISGGSLTVNYNPAYPSDTVNYPNALRSGSISAQFSAAVSLNGSGALSVHTLQVDASRTFTLSGGSLTFDRINLMPASSTPAKILLAGDVSLNPLA
ncbi:MAG TPA: glycoside hydrolase family 25 protein, partial [Pirellulaceae bacterium]